MRYSIIALILVVTSTAHAAEEAGGKRGFAALLAGPGFTTSTGGGTHFSYGARLGYTLGESKEAIGSLGVAFSSLSRTEQIGTITDTGTTNFIALDYVARKAWGSPFYFGGRFGVGLNSVKLSGPGGQLSDTNSVFAFAPVVGVESPLGNGGASVMLDISWVNVGGGTFVLGGSPVAYDHTASVLMQLGIALGF